MLKLAFFKASLKQEDLHIRLNNYFVLHFNNNINNFQNWTGQAQNV